MDEMIDELNMLRTQVRELRNERDDLVVALKYIVSHDYYDGPTPYRAAIEALAKVGAGKTGEGS